MKMFALPEYLMRFFPLPILLAFLLALSGCSSPGEVKGQNASGASAEVPVKGMVTMVDLGAKSCIPCKMMAPILAELEAAYKGKAAIVFIDVWERPDQSEKFGLRSIPTQIFYDQNGRERWRHEGFLDKEAIIAKLKILGVDGGK